MSFASAMSLAWDDISLAIGLDDMIDANSEDLTVSHFAADSEGVEVDGENDKGNGSKNKPTESAWKRRRDLGPFMSRFSLVQKI